MDKKKRQNSLFNLQQRENISIVPLSVEELHRKSEEIKNIPNTLYFDRLRSGQINEELNKAIKQISAVKSKYETLQDNAPVGILTLNSQGLIIDINKWACDLFSNTKSQLLTLHYTSFIHSEDLPCFNLFFSTLLLSPKSSNIYFRVKQQAKDRVFLCEGLSVFSEDDSTIKVLLLLRCNKDQNKENYSIYLDNEALKQKISFQTIELISKNIKLEQNIKDIEKSKQQLMEREAKLNSIFNAAIEGIVTVNNKGTIESLNTAVTTIFGYGENELIGKSITKLLFLPKKETLKNFYTQNHLAVKACNGKGGVRLIDGQRKDGSLISVDVSVSEYFFDQSLFYTAIIRDVSKRVEKEKLDKDHLDRLAHVTRMGLMGELASGLAHEVNQPLTAISTYSKVCLRTIENDTPDLKVLSDTLEKVEKQATRAGQIISRMKNFISSKSSRRSTVDINKLVHNVINLACDESRRNSIQCSFKLDTSLSCIIVDSIQIEQVLLNIIKNSIDILGEIPKEKQRKISIQTYSQEINKKQYVEIRIKDNGTGINGKVRDNIFKPFYSTKKSGMGIGLSICKSLVLAHEGTLTFNTSNKGTTFYITLPTNIGSNHDA